MGLFDKLKKSLGIEAEDIEKDVEKIEYSQALSEEKEEVQEEKIVEEKKVKVFSFRKPPISQPQQMKEELETTFNSPESWQDLETEGELAVDVFETDKEFKIVSTLGGVSADDLEVEVSGDTVTIKGRRENPIKEMGKYLRQECYWGSFSATILLPEEVEADLADAVLKEGIFVLKLPKKANKAPRKIKVRG